MKISLIASLMILCATLPVMAGEVLKLELVAPKEPIALSEAQLEELANAVAAQDALNAEDEGGKPDPTDLARLRKMAEATKKAKLGIELSYRITNVSDAAVTIDHGGDATTNLLKIKGPGAVNLAYRGMMTMEFRMGKPVTIEPGKSKEFTISELKYGKRNMSRWLITKPGEYEVTLVHRTKMGGAALELESNPATFTVEVQ